MSVSYVARLHGIRPSLLFKWKKQYQEGCLTAVAVGEDVVPASELAAASSRFVNYSVCWVRSRGGWSEMDSACDLVSKGQ